MDTNEYFNYHFEHHNKMSDIHGFNEKALWGSKESQVIRFHKLSEIIRGKENFTVLDLGCGLCDYYKFLLENNYTNFKYTGVEINQKFIDESIKKYPEIELINGSVEQINKNQTWDYIIASGIYNLGPSVNEVDDFFLDQFKKLLPLINIGFSANFLSVFSKNKDLVSIYHDPKKIFDICMHNFTTKVSLHHDYLPHDFTIFVSK